MRHLSDDERRRRIAVRHGIAPEYRFSGLADATAAMVAWHATDSSTVHLAALARVAQLGVPDVEDALYQSRSLVKLLAMRRTLFAFPRDLLPAALGAASARVAGALSRRIVRVIEANQIAPDGGAWLARALAAALDAVPAGGSCTTAQVRDATPELQVKVMVSPDSRWGGEIQIAPWVVNVLVLQGLLVRADNAGHWRLNKPTWAAAADWLGSPVTPLPSREGYAQLVSRWLASFGPGTESDLVWWLGSTRTAVRAALDDVGAQQVSLDDGGVGYVLSGDDAPTPPVEPWAALLPTLDPTTMGWKERDFYLPREHVPYLFDTAGNGGATAWWDGRIVGCWAQPPDGSVVLSLREALEPRAMHALKVERARLESFLDGVVISSPYASQQMRGARLP